MSHPSRLYRNQRKTARKKRLLDRTPYRPSASWAGTSVLPCACVSRDAQKSGGWCGDDLLSPTPPFCLLLFPTVEGGSKSFPSFRTLFGSFLGIAGRTSPALADRVIFWQTARTSYSGLETRIEQPAKHRRIVWLHRRSTQPSADQGLFSLTWITPYPDHIGHCCVGIGQHLVRTRSSGL